MTGSRSVARAEALRWSFGLSVYILLLCLYSEQDYSIDTSAGEKLALQVCPELVDPILPNTAACGFAFCNSSSPCV
jgi:hypothetical protein